MSYLTHTQGFNGIMDIYMHDAERYLPLAQLTVTVMERESELTKVEKEMIALRVSTLNGCTFCEGSHAAVLDVHGLETSDIDAAKQGKVTDEKFNAVLTFASRLTTHPKDVSQSDVDHLKSAGWSDQAVEDVIVIVSLFSFINRLLDGLGVTGNPEEYIKGAQFIANAGYAPAVGMLSPAS